MEIVITYQFKFKYNQTVIDIGNITYQKNQNAQIKYEYIQIVTSDQRNIS